MSKEVFLTKDGVTRLQDELAVLVNKRRKDNIRRIEEAKELGDLSENAEYQEAKEEQAFIEGRILEIENLLKNATIVNTAGSGEVVVGATVTVKNGDREVKYAIVGSSEADPLNNKISNESPLGKSFLGKKVGEKAVVVTPNGDREYEIVKID